MNQNLLLLKLSTPKNQILLWESFTDIHGPRNSPQQSAIAEGFAEANSVFIVMTWVEILSRLFPSKIYIQYTIFNIYFLTKLLFTNKRYHLHVQRRVCMCYKVTYLSYIFGSLFILFLFIHVVMEQALLSCQISSYPRNSVTSHV